VNDDDRLTQYLSDRAEAVALAPGDVRKITARAARHRRSRQAMSVAAAAILLIGAVVLLSRSPSHQSVKVAGQAGVDRAPLTWSAVDVTDGLAWGRDAVDAGHGSLFSLSTAPGPVNPTDVATKAVLYQSSDGRSWTTAGLPDDLSASALAASSGSLYAVGTAPGGGGSIDLVVASSNDGAHTWSEARLPQPAADVKARFPNEVQILAPVITSGPHGVVAAVTVVAMPDLAPLLPADAQTSGWQMNATGVDVFAPEPGCDPAKGIASSSSESSPPSTASASTIGACASKQPTVAKSYTWDELGIDPALRQLVGGQVHLYTSSDGGSFEEIPNPGIDGGYTADLIAGRDSYRLLVSGAFNGAIQPYSSPDGVTWTKSGSTFDGWIAASGTLAGNPVVVLDSVNGPEILSATPDGGWTAPAGLSAALRLPGASGPGVQSAVIGPLGIAMVVLAGDTSYLVESTDGRQFTTRPVQDVAGPGSWIPDGITMNPDAVIVRLMPAMAPGSDPSATPVPGPQRLLVGTPG
jgi:hypothetical protein